MAVRNPRLPLLPGYGANTTIGRTKFGVKPIFTAIDKVNMLVDKAEEGNRVPSLYCRKQTPELPTWIMYDKHILRFEAFFQQTLHENRTAPNILRKVNILFFLEDGTIKVMEPRTENSGLSQGTMISRQRIRLPYSYDTYYDVLDLNIGREVTLFGKNFKIVNCDNFTRVFLNRLGINVPDPINWPDALEIRPDARKPPKHFSFKQFLDFDRQVLRFYGYWDDRESEFGMIHRLEIHYFLADDTIEIKESLPENSGMESGPMFLKRMRLPRKIPAFVEMTGGPKSPSYTPADLSIGAVLNVFGRKVTLTDCDPYTKEYYRVTYGFDTFTPLPLPNDEKECVAVSVADRELPPWNGLGSYDDSAENCRTVEPKAPHRDFMKFLNKDRFGFDSHILRFAARIVNDVDDDKRRYFIIKYFLCDDTIGIFELGERNSGYPGGKFFRRDKMYLPDVDFFVPKEPPSYTDKDMWVGNELIINKHRFRLIAADEYALRYLEIHATEYPMANIALIIDKIRRTLASVENGYKNFVAKYMAAVVPNKKELMSVRCFKQALQEIMCEKMTEHEFLTLIRYFRGDPGQEVDNPRREMIRSLVFSELTRGLWDDRARLREGILHADDCATGALSMHRVRQLLRAHRLPINVDLMDCMLNVLNRDDQCNILWEDLLNFLDFQTRPVYNLTEADYQKVVRHAPPVKDTECKIWTDIDTLIKEGYVNWNAFLCQLNLDHLVKDQS